MHSNLLDVLVDRGIVNDQTEFGIRIEQKEVGGIKKKAIEETFNYVAHICDDGVNMIIGESVRDGKQSHFFLEQVVTIDSMAPERFASIYYISPTGEKINMAARRGRKPKNPIHGFIDY